MAESLVSEPLVRRWARASGRWCPEVAGALEAWAPHDIDGSLERVEQALYDTRPDLDLVIELGARVAACGLADELLREAQQATSIHEHVVAARLRRIGTNVLVRAGVAPTAWIESAPS